MANEIELNGLADTNNLPDDWKISLINPVTLQPAQNITVARFLELLTEKMPEATKESKGLISNLGFSSLITFKGLWSKNNVDLLTENGTWMNGGGENMTSEIMGWGLLCVIRANFYIVQISVAPEAIRFRYSGDGGKSWADPVILNKSRTYSAMANPLTDTIQASLYHSSAETKEHTSLNNSVLPPPCKLRAKLLYYRQFSRTICGVRCIGFSQSGRFNTS